MRDARFTIPTPGLLAKVVDLIAKLPMEDRDTKGDLYEYMLGKIATAGQNGQFRTPRHLIRLMVELTAPEPTDVICDPAVGTPAFSSLPVNTYANAIRNSSSTKSTAITSTVPSSTASISTTPCCASPA